MLSRNFLCYVAIIVTMLGIDGARQRVDAQGTAQPYPSAPVRIIVPYPAGGAADGLARVIAAKLSDAWGQRLIVENRPGGNTLIGMDLVAKAVPDGYTLLLSSDQSLVMNPHLYDHLPYDPVKDFEPISHLASVAQALCVHESVPVHSVQELIRLAKSKPDELTYGSTGVGSTTHLNTELLKSTAGIELRHVPYKGGGQAITDLVGGQISLMIIAVSLVEPHVKSGALRALAVAGRQRSPLLPDVPTFAEAGLSGYEAQPWFGLLAPAGTPKELVARISRDTVGVLRMPELQGTFRTQGMDLVGSTPEEFADFMKVENIKWKKVIQQIGVKLK